ncbi:MAG: AAA family ATPase [Acetobacteraceae bacterium]
MTPHTVTTFRDHAATVATEDALSLHQLSQRILATSAPNKAALPWLKLALFGDTRTAKGSLRHNGNVLFISGIEGDYDGEAVQPAEAVCRLQAADLSALVYTSPSHTADRPRWRVLCPVSEWLLPSRHAALVARLNGLLGGVLARESFTLSQAYYYGRVGTAPDHGVWVVEGSRLIDQADGLAAGATYPATGRPVDVPALPAGLAPDQHAQTALTTAAAMFDGAGTPDRPRHSVLLAATALVAPMVKSGHLDSGTVADVLSDAMARSGRTPNEGEVESALSGALRYVAAYIPDTGGAEFDGVPVPVAAPTRTLRLIHPADCETGPRRGYVVKHLIAPGDVGALIGPPGCGKSMLAPMIAYAVARGAPVFGLRTKPARTLYVAAEDATGMRQRVHALKLRHGDAPDFALCETGNLRDPGAAALLRDTVRQYMPALVVIDTVGAAWAGMDENSAQDMGAVVAAARDLAAMGVAVLLVHHTAKHGDGTPRGHSVLNGTLDVSVRLEPADESGVIRGVLGKNRNGPADRRIAFRAEAVSLGQDEDGDDITAPLAVPVDGPAGRRVERLPRTEAAALAVLRDLIADNGGPVDEATWRRECDNRRVSTSDNAKNRADVMRRAYAGLLARGLVEAGDGRVGLVEADDEFAAIEATESDNRATIAIAERPDRATIATAPLGRSLSLANGGAVVSGEGMPCYG